MAKSSDEEKKRHLEDESKRKASSERIEIDTDHQEEEKEEKEEEEEKEEKETKDFKVGTKVQALFGGGKKYYSGTIARVHRDGSYTIEYDDGDVEKRVKPKVIRLLNVEKKEKTKRERSQSRKEDDGDTVVEGVDDEAENPKHQFKVKDKVQVKDVETDSWEEAIIVEKAPDGLYTVQYENEDDTMETDVAAKRIRKVKKASRQSDVGSERDEKETLFQQGEEVQMMDEGTWVNATIESVRKDGTYDLRYEDGGGIEKKIKGSRLRKRLADLKKNDPVRYKSKKKSNRWHDGMVKKVSKDGNTYDIEHLSDAENMGKSIDRHLIELRQTGLLNHAWSALKQHMHTKFRVNDEVKFKDAKGKMHDGTIIKARADSTFDIQHISDEEHVSTKIPRENIQSQSLFLSTNLMNAWKANVASRDERAGGRRAGHGHGNIITSNAFVSFLDRNGETHRGFVVRVRENDTLDIKHESDDEVVSKRIPRSEVQILLRHGAFATIAATLTRGFSSALKKDDPVTYLDEKDRSHEGFISRVRSDGTFDIQHTSDEERGGKNIPRGNIQRHPPRNNYTRSLAPTLVKGKELWATAWGSSSQRSLSVGKKVEFYLRARDDWVEGFITKVRSDGEETFDIEYNNTPPGIGESDDSEDHLDDENEKDKEKDKDIEEDARKGNERQGGRRRKKGARIAKKIPRKLIRLLPDESGGGWGPAWSSSFFHDTSFEIGAIVEVQEKEKENEKEKDSQQSNRNNRNNRNNTLSSNKTTPPFRVARIVSRVEKIESKNQVKTWEFTVEYEEDGEREKHVCLSRLRLRRRSMDKLLTLGALVDFIHEDHITGAVSKKKGQVVWLHRDGKVVIKTFADDCVFATVSRDALLLLPTKKHAMPKSNHAKQVFMKNTNQELKEGEEKEEEEEENDKESEHEDKEENEEKEMDALASKRNGKERRPHGNSNHDLGQLRFTRKEYGAYAVNLFVEVLIYACFAYGVCVQLSDGFHVFSLSHSDHLENVHEMKAWFEVKAKAMMGEDNVNANASTGDASRVCLDARWGNSNSTYHPLVPNKVLRTERIYLVAFLLGNVALIATFVAMVLYIVYSKISMLRDNFISFQEKAREVHLSRVLSNLFLPIFLVSSSTLLVYGSFINKLGFYCLWDMNNTPNPFNTSTSWEYNIDAFAFQVNPFELRSKEAVTLMDFLKLATGKTCFHLFAGITLFIVLELGPNLTSKLLAIIPGSLATSIMSVKTLATFHIFHYVQRTYVLKGDMTLNFDLDLGIALVVFAHWINAIIVSLFLQMKHYVEMHSRLRSQGQCVDDNALDLAERGEFGLQAKKEAKLERREALERQAGLLRMSIVSCYRYFWIHLIAILFSFFANIALQKTLKDHNEEWLKYTSIDLAMNILWMIVLVFILWNIQFIRTHSPELLRCD